MRTDGILGLILVICSFILLILNVGTGRAKAQSAFRNIQVLNDLTDREIQQTMQAWTQQFSVTCFECHVQGDFASDELERKQTTRRMAEVVRALNATSYFAEASRKADCFLCHQGSFEIPEMN
jgi:hypothetical protein